MRSQLPPCSSRPFSLDGPEHGTLIGRKEEIEWSSKRPA